MNLLDLASHSQRWQMHHHADSNSRSHVGWTRGQITQLRMKRERNGRFNLIVERITFLPAIIQCKATVQYLNSQMIFFINHHAVTFALTDRNGARTISTSQLAAD